MNFAIDIYCCCVLQKQQEMNKNKEIIVLDHKRSNAINIGMTKLPPPRAIKTAILKMDATVMNREGIEVSINVNDSRFPKFIPYLYRNEEVARW